MGCSWLETIVATRLLQHDPSIVLHYIDLISHRLLVVTLGCILGSNVLLSVCVFPSSFVFFLVLLTLGYDFFPHVKVFSFLPINEVEKVL